MYFRRLVLGSIAGTMLLAAMGRAETSGSVEVPGVDQLVGGRVGSLPMLKTYRSARVSSEDRKGNADARPIAPGASLTLAELTGPGEIVHLWTTIASPDANHLRNLVIRIYWEGNDYPSVESPIGDFYGLGNAKYYYFNNPVQAIGTVNGMNCFWPMPFRKAAKIVVTNEGTKPVHAFYYYVDWRKLDTVPENFGYFNAQYHQAFPNESGKPYLILDTAGGPGHYVGVSLSIHTRVPGWWGEGDDMMTIDGESSPSIWGTGSEDYFSGAWCYGDTFYTDYFGMPYRGRMDHEADNYWNVYRLHLESPIAFQKEIRVEIEHGAGGFDETRPISNNDYSSCVYYYTANLQPLKGALPKAADRMPKIMPFDMVTEIETQQLPFETNVAEGGLQEMAPFGNKGNDWVSRDQTFFHPGKKDQVSTFTFEVAKELEAPLKIQYTKAPDYATIRVALDDKTLIKNLDCYSKKVEAAVTVSPAVKLGPGKHTLSFTIVGKNQASKGFCFGLDTFAPVKEPAKPAKQAKKTRKQ